MSRWTPEHSVLLSQLLDIVVGTPEMVKIRRDLCDIDEAMCAVTDKTNSYFTGSRAEGLELPGSDTDIMIDMNRQLIIVIQEGQAVPQSYREHLFMMVTDNVHPAFALLRRITPHVKCSRGCVMKPCLQDMNGFQFLSSFLVVHNYRKCDHSNTKIQGPSREHPTHDGTGEDRVTSLHCSFWPRDASEWINRTRTSGWPWTDVVNKIVNFGFHLVPVGYPHSPKRMMEWRISFSIAERLLVWSLNHVQLQMYAILKIILKEFIKPNCKPENYTLCSYFIKTFLFWKFEETDRTFWTNENFIDCLRFLMIEFHTMLQHGILKHYFIPIFNLLEVKMTREAKSELLRITDMVIQYDIRIINQCQTLKLIWKKFSEGSNDPKMSLICTRQRNCVRCYLTRQNFINTSEYVMSLSTLKCENFNLCTWEKNLNIIIEKSSQTSTSLGTRLVGIECENLIVSHLKFWPQRNKDIYNLIRLFINEICTYDISTGKLWTAIMFLSKSDYNRCLLTIHNLLSSISPHTLYRSRCQLVSGRDAQNLYIDTYLNSGLNFAQIARRAWLKDFVVFEDSINLVPAAMQIELMHDYLVPLSPFVCAYYLQFLCYHGLGQFDNRDNALRQLMEALGNRKQCGSPCIWYYAYNIAGHCLLVVGDRVRAKEMFIKSCEMHSIYGSKCEPRQNSAVYYLRKYF